MLWTQVPSRAVLSTTQPFTGTRHHISVSLRILKYILFKSKKPIIHYPPIEWNHPDSVTVIHHSWWNTPIATWLEFRVSILVPNILAMRGIRYRTKLARGQIWVHPCKFEHDFYKRSICLSKRTYTMPLNWFLCININFNKHLILFWIKYPSIPRMASIWRHEVRNFYLIPWNSNWVTIREFYVNFDISPPTI